MKTMNLRHEIFIRELIAHGDRQRAYRAAYPKSALNSAYASASRLMARPEISSRLMHVSGAVEHAATMIMEQKQQFILSDVWEKRRELAKIIRGEKRYPKLIRTRTGSYTVYRMPTASEVLNAIVLDTKLEQQCRNQL